MKSNSGVLKLVESTTIERSRSPVSQNRFSKEKFVTFLSVPSNLLVLSAIVSLIILVFHRRVGAILAVCSLAAFAISSLSPLGNMLLTPLEERFPEQVYPANIQGIIVLGGSYDTVSHGYMSTIVLEEDTEPLAVMVDLARRYPEAKIIFSGGTASSVPGPSEADIVKGYFVSFGIAPDRILTEGQSQTTEENARFTARLLRPTPSSHWLLVTSGYHMPRAMGAFRKAGFNVSAFPVGLRTHGWRDMWKPEAVATDNLRRVDIALHEWIGLIDYKLKGYSDCWFAAPTG
jgi:uncharacterized SAM-binding protein YcdF (DUF218 family)